MEKFFVCKECGFESNSLIDPEKHKNVHKILDLLDDISGEEIDFIWGKAEQMSEEYIDAKMKLKPELYTDERMDADIEKMLKKKSDD